MLNHASADHFDPEERLPDTADARSHIDIAALAYELWISRGCRDGSAEEDWFEAERRLGVSEPTPSYSK